MKTLFAGYIEKVTAFIKKKKDFSFLNAAGILLLCGILIVTFYFRYLIQNDLKNEDGTFINTSVSHDLTYIKPFTSLVGFNWKFGKDNKRKVKESKTLVIPIINYKASF